VGGFRNSMTMVLTGLDIEAKAAWAEKQLFEVLGGRDRFAEVDVRLLRFDTPDAPTNERAAAHLRVTVKDPDPRTVGRAFSNGIMELALAAPAWPGPASPSHAFSNGIMELALAGYGGFHTTTAPTPESAYGVYRPAAVPRSAVEHLVVLPDGERRTIPDPPTAVPSPSIGATAPPASAPSGPTLLAPPGAVLGARSGDKGGNANIGLWARDDASYAWAREHLTIDRLRALLGPEAADLDIERFELPNLRALNVVVHGLLTRSQADR